MVVTDQHLENIFQSCQCELTTTEKSMLIAFACSTKSFIIVCFDVFLFLHLVSVF